MNAKNIGVLGIGAVLLGGIVYMTTSGGWRDASSLQSNVTGVVTYECSLENQKYNESFYVTARELAESEDCKNSSQQDCQDAKAKKKEYETCREHLTTVTRTPGACQNGAKTETVACIYDSVPVKCPDSVTPPKVEDCANQNVEQNRDANAATPAAYNGNFQLLDMVSDDVAVQRLPETKGSAFMEKSISGTYNAQALGHQNLALGSIIVNMRGLSSAQLAVINGTNTSLNFGGSWENAVEAAQGRMIVGANRAEDNYLATVDGHSVYVKTNIHGEIMGFMYPTTWGMIFIDIDAPKRRVVTGETRVIDWAKTKDILLTVLKEYLDEYPASVDFGEWADKTVNKRDNTPLYTDGQSSWLKYLPTNQLQQISNEIVPTL